MHYQIGNAKQQNDVAGRYAALQPLRSSPEGAELASINAVGIKRNANITEANPLKWSV